MAVINGGFTDFFLFRVIILLRKTCVLAQYFGGMKRNDENRLQQPSLTENIPRLRGYGRILHILEI